MPRQHQQDHRRRWSPIKIVSLGLLGVAGFFLLTEHTAHVFDVLPWLLIAGCPLMHLFMHHGHRGAHDHSGEAGHSGSGPAQKS